MASSLATQRVGSNSLNKIEKVTGGTTAFLGVKHAMRDYGRVAMTVALVGKTGNGVTLAEIVGCTDSSGSNPTSIKSSGAVVMDATGTSGSVLPDQVYLEATASEINAIGKAAGLDLTHVAARITANNSSDVAAVAWHFCEARYQYDALTPVSTIAA